MIPGAHKHSKAVAVDMAVAYLSVALLEINDRGRMTMPRNVYRMSLKEVLQHIKNKQSVQGQPQKLFNDNTINLASIAATKELAPSGASIVKDEATCDILIILAR
jgi:hypothetical protein